jgi:hypothetical protein
MCDYSLMCVPNRLARDGEELIVHRFCTGTMGLAPAADLQTRAESSPPEPRTFWATLAEILSPPKNQPVTAVCIPPGARLLLQDIPERLQDDLGVGPGEEVTFTQMTPSAYRYRDAVRFRNGREILLQQLREGQHVRVLALSSAETTEPIEEVLVSVR